MMARPKTNRLKSSQDPPLRVSIFYRTPENGEYLRQVVTSSGPGVKADTRELSRLPAPGANHADIILLEYAEDNRDLDHWLEQSAGLPGTPPILLYSQEISTSCLRKALRFGAKECFTYPLDGAEFRDAVNRILARTVLASEPGTATRIITFLGCKGGVGTTFITANVAGLLAQEYKERVLAMDLDLHFGQLCSFFDVKPRYTLNDAVSNLDHLDTRYLQNILHAYHPLLHLLPTPSRMEDADAITPGQVEKILRHLKHHLGFAWILLDCCHQLDDITLKALELSDELALITTPSIPALANAKKVLEVIKLLGFEGLKPKLWVNAWEKQCSLSRAEVEGFLGTAIAGTVACDHRLVERSINEGKPLVGTAPRHPLRDDLKRIAQSLGGGGGAVQDAGRSWFQRLWRRS